MADTPGKRPKSVGGWLRNAIATIKNIPKETMADASLGAEVSRLKREVKQMSQNPQDHPELPDNLSRLSHLLCQLYESQRLEFWWDEALRRGREAIAATQADDPQLLARHSALAEVFMARYRRTGQVELLEEALRIAEGAVPAAIDNKKSASGDNKGLSAILTTLGNILGSRFQWTGNMKDLEASISRTEQAIKFISLSDDERPIMLNNLATKLLQRYDRTFEMGDLDMAIRVAQEAEKDSSYKTWHPNLRPPIIVSLCTMFLRKASREHSHEHVQRAISMVNDTLQLVPLEDQNRPLLLLSYAAGLEYRFQETGNMDDLEESIRAVEVATRATPFKHPDTWSRYYRLSQLRLLEANSGGSTRLLKNLRSFGKAHSAAKVAVDALPKGHPGSAQALCLLGDIAKQRYDWVQRETHLDEARYSYAAAVQCQTGKPLIRIEAGWKGGLVYIEEREWLKASLMLELAIAIMPLLSRQLLSRDDQQFVLSHFPYLAATAASVILEAKRTNYDAIVALESGRGLMAGLLIDTRSDVSDLRKDHRDFCDQYVELQKKISLPTPTTGQVGNSKASEEFTISAVSQRIQSVSELEELEKRIRRLPGFDRFQLKPSRDDFIALAADGPIVSFNVTTYRSDAFLVTKKGICVVKLPRLDINSLKKLVSYLVGERKLAKCKVKERPQKNMKMRELLKWLWDVAVRPVLDRLAALSLLSSDTCSSSRLPRLWWITNGLVGLTPLHAAGSGWGKTLDNTMSRLVSSYVPSFKALVYARQKAKALKDARGKPGEACTGQSHSYLIVSMPKTAGMPPLKVSDEVRAIEANISAAKTSTAKYTLLPTPSKCQVLDGLRSATVAHFICHGSSNPSNPSDSSLFLKAGPNGRAETLTVRDLTAMSLEKAEIAYLSACSTAENSSKTLVDESIHVASAFHLAGFPHVIGTVWEASNQTASDIAGSFYKALLKSRQISPDSDDATAYALDEALRAYWGKPRVRENRTGDVISWVPFIHIGA